MHIIMTTKMQSRKERQPQQPPLLSALGSGVWWSNGKKPKLLRSLRAILRAWKNVFIGIISVRVRLAIEV